MHRFYQVTDGTKNADTLIYYLFIFIFMAGVY